MELQLVLAPGDSNKTKEVVALVRRFRDREQRRARIAATLASLRASPLSDEDKAALERLESQLKMEMPPTLDAFLDQLHAHFVDADPIKNEAALAWWKNWNRGQRQDALAKRMATAQSLCSISEKQLGIYREILQALRTNQPPRVDLLLEDLEMRMPSSGCFKLESTLGWWSDQKLEAEVLEMVALLEEH